MKRIDRPTPGVVAMLPKRQGRQGRGDLRAANARRFGFWARLRAAWADAMDRWTA